MKLRQISFALLLPLTVMGMGTIGQEQPKRPYPWEAAAARLGGDYGHWWTIMPDDAKKNFVDGYATAMFRVNFMTHSLGMDRANNAKPGSPEFQPAINCAMDLGFLAKEFDFQVDQRKLVNELDAFYGDPRNVRILIDDAFDYVRAKLKGDTSPSALEEKLTRLQQQVNK